MLTANNVKDYIETSLPCEYVEVEGDDGHHFHAVIVSAQFQGKNMVQQHQLVSMKTLTPEQWANRA